MQRFICAIVSVLAVVNASPYGSNSGRYDTAPLQGSGRYDTAPVQGSGYGEVLIVEQPSVSYNIPAPSVWNEAPAAATGPALLPVRAHSITGAGTTSKLVGSSSRPIAIAGASSANVPLNAGNYKLLVVPSYAIPNVVGPELALPTYSTSASGGYGGRVASY